MLKTWFIPPPHVRVPRHLLEAFNGALGFYVEINMIHYLYVRICSLLIFK